MKKAFRFGVVAGGHTSRAAWVALAQRVEELGYSTLFFPDVLGTPLSIIPALTAAAAATTKLRVGSFVFVNDYRHPALLARDIASLDCLSDGRVELGLGAGNWPRDFQQLGIPFDSAGTRVSRFMEGFAIIKKFLTSETVDFSGKYYTVTDLHPLPRPVQQPHPPILIGSGGRRMLTLAAREADIIMPVAFQGDSIEEKIGWIREAAGERFEHLEFCQNVFGIELTDGPVPAEPIRQGGIPVEARPMTTEQAVAYLQEQRERLGFSYFQIQPRQLENFVPVLAQLNGK
ncbi:N5,N10-methylene tetrahydromethanopterin reductase [Reticulibacter mediterranei]|uniref:N5,N10-methylene tetrahydromethanopterin reductase n=1 Tax=Reticulibacter mediterranei TaxID=2778369 RepID=A0A8J3IPI2_9CHLR|nr:TIGR03621 family F420-dependent LLM class oxidoreductase [Reticulibacter mediterranei]GHO98336.1 N5,N10-methylene tetrahydromethanopterin reductase [Reticulibacter mediterranei]